MKKTKGKYLITGRTHGMTVQAVSAIDATSQFIEVHPDEEIDLIQVENADGTLSIATNEKGK